MYSHTIAKTDTGGSQQPEYFFDLLAEVSFPAAEAAVLPASPGRTQLKHPPNLTKKLQTSENS